MTIYKPGKDSFLMKGYIDGTELQGKKVLDMGTGSGIIAITAAEKGADVTAVDISSEALEFAEEKARGKGLENIKFQKSDLFQNVEEEFDYIFFNPPYLPGEQGIGDENIWRGGLKGIEVTERFLESADDYLSEDGEILLVMSSRADFQELVDRFDLEIVDSEKIWFETLYLARSK